MSWMRQHSNSSMRSSHSVPENKHTKGFLDFQRPKESTVLNTEIQTIDILNIRRVILPVLENYLLKQKGLGIITKR